MAELTREVKELRKELLASKLDKKQVEVQMKDLKDALELGGNLRQGYVDSQEHMAVARRGLINMMEDMNEIPIDDVKRDLDRLNGHLDQIFHECSIREDDPDFKSTADGLKNMAANMNKINLIMLRSELENLQALLEDTSEWRSPNFFALAYYLQHEEESKVGEMENEFRNSFLERYLEEHLMESLAMEANYAGCGEKLAGLARLYTSGHLDREYRRMLYEKIRALTAFYGVSTDYHRKLREWEEQTRGTQLSLF